MADNAFLPEPKSLYHRFSNDGDFGTAELSAVLECLGANQFDAEQIETMLTQLDIDGDGVVSEQDFVTSMTPFIEALQTKIPEEPSSPQSDNRRISSSIRDPSVDTFEARLEDALAALTTAPAATVQGVKRMVLAEVDALGARFDELKQTAHREQRRLTELNEQLTLECQRIESELTETSDAALRSHAILAENNRLKMTLEELKADLHKQSGGEQTQKEHITTLNAEVGTLQKQRSDLALKYESLTEHAQALEQQNQLLTLDLQQLQDDHAKVTSELHRLIDSQREDENALKTLGNTTSMQEHEVAQLQQALHNMEEALEMKDAEVHGLRDELNEQKMLLASLNGNDSRATGSVLNEIEDLVMFQMREEHQDTQKTTVEMLQRILPRLEETRLSSNGDGLVAQTFGGASPRRRRRKKRRDGARSAPVTPQKLPDGAIAAIQAPRAALPQLSPPGSLLSTEQITPTKSRPMAVATEPVTPTHPVDSAVDVETSESTPKTEADSSDDEQSKADNVVEDKLNQVLRLYAASTQHLVGVKIVTPDMAAQMDVESLQQMKQTLTDLVTARNRLLLKVLNEREGLQNEIHLKQTVLKPVIDMVLAANLESHPASQPGTPTMLNLSHTQLPTMQTPSTRSITRRGSRLDSTTTPMSGARKLMHNIGRFLTPNSDKKEGHEVKV
eukprot:TRINITY_DN6325_c0_g1_i1.p1 TRINITY_DN6325_c0_g1~~TRINITY_DN6325_c0_g1_i1.p1  ORF type:complete len:676 (+),score=167.88 TRINITY_DN6325_c0_g1_i1:132-2159(+)